MDDIKVLKQLNRAALIASARNLVAQKRGALKIISACSVVGTIGAVGEAYSRWSDIVDMELHTLFVGVIAFCILQFFMLVAVAIGSIEATESIEDVVNALHDVGEELHDA